MINAQGKRPSSAEIAWTHNHEMWGSLDQSTLEREGIEQTPGWETHFIQGPQGSRLAVEAGGHPGNFVALCYSGTPGGRGGPKPDLAAYPEGVLTIWYDQPGYGYSTLRPKRKVLDAVKDAEAILAYFDVARFGVVGRSGGAGRALAVAAHVKGAVSAAVIVPNAPQSAMGDHWYEGMGAFNTEIFKAIFEADHNNPYTNPYALPAHDPLSIPRQELEAHRIEILQKWTQLNEGSLPQDDLETGITARALGAYAAALKFGSQGRMDDLESFRTWGFDLNKVRIPTLIWGARKDIFTPFAHAEFLAEKIGSNALLHSSPSATHYDGLDATAFGVRWCYEQSKKNL